MKVVLHYSGFMLIIDGVFHMLFPKHWDTLLLTTTRRAIPGIGRSVERAYLSVPPARRRAQGFAWIGAGALLLWLGGSVD